MPKIKLYRCPGPPVVFAVLFAVLFTTFFTAVFAAAFTAVVSFTSMLCACSPSPTHRTPPMAYESNETREHAHPFETSHPEEQEHDHEKAESSTMAPRSDTGKRSELSFSERIANAAKDATPAGRAIIQTANRMIEEKTIIKSSCWGYVNAVYKRAGYGRSKRIKTVFVSPKKGPYADTSLVQTGDWLYIVKYPKTMGTHSVIFVYWKNKALNEAVVIDYVGDKREIPGTYNSTNLSTIYRIKRPIDP